MRQDDERDIVALAGTHSDELYRRRKELYFVDGEIE
jgi:hypothetical protein